MSGSPNMLYNALVIAVFVFLLCVAIQKLDEWGGMLANFSVMTEIFPLMGIVG